MNIEDVRAFVAVVDAGSVGRAAVRLNLTQPAVSRRIQRLEQALGVNLLDRDSKPARPTRLGEMAYGRCVSVLRATEALTRDALGAPPSGPLRIGVSPGIAESIFACALEAVRHGRPDVALRLSTARSVDLRKQAADGLIDAAIVMARMDRPIEAPTAVALGSERVVVVAPGSARLASPCGLADLGGWRWVINPDGCGFRTQLDQALAATGRGLEVAAESWGTALQLVLVARGAGLGLVPERLIAESPHRAALQTVKVRDFRPQLAVWLIGSAPSGPFADTLQAVAAAVRRVLAKGRAPAAAGRRAR